LNPLSQTGAMSVPRSRSKIVSVEIGVVSFPCITEAPIPGSIEHTTGASGYVCATGDRVRFDARWSWTRRLAVSPASYCFLPCLGPLVSGTFAGINSTARVLRARTVHRMGGVWPHAWSRSRECVHSSGRSQGQWCPSGRVECFHDAIVVPGCQIQLHRPHLFSPPAPNVAPCNTID
jgi:hypothetical protein